MGLATLTSSFPWSAPSSAAGPGLPPGEGPTGCRRERERRQERGRSQERRQPSSSSSEKQRFYSCDRFGGREPPKPKPSLSSHPTSPTAGQEPGPHPQVRGIGEKVRAQLPLPWPSTTVPQAPPSPQGLPTALCCSQQPQGPGTPSVPCPGARVCTVPQLCSPQAPAWVTLGWWFCVLIHFQTWAPKSSPLSQSLLDSPSLTVVVGLLFCPFPWP